MTARTTTPARSRHHGAMARPTRAATALVVVLGLFVAACGAPAAPAPGPAPSDTDGGPALRDLAPDGVLVGSSVVGGGHVSDDPFTTDDAYRALLAGQFSSLTPENALKWESVHPGRDRYDFAAADAVVDFAEQHHQQVRGHNLLWSQQNPGWLTGGHFSDDELRGILRDHITTVVGHFKGRIAAWDVANEVYDDQGDVVPGNPFLEQLGTGILADAFRWAHQADPDAVLYLNDYGVESSKDKRDAYRDLVKKLQDEDVPVGGMGLQGHLSLDDPFPSDLADTLDEFAGLGLDVAVTELDVRIRLHGDEPDDDQLADQADYFRKAVTACLDVDRCRSVTLWGSPDTYSWVPSTFPDEGAATPWADDATPKPAYAALAQALAAG